MKIRVPTNAVVTTGSKLVVSLGDRGGAFVSIIFQIGDKEPIRFNESYAGDLTVDVSMRRGQYPCALQVSAYKYGAFSPTYDTTVKVNGVECAAASGAVPSSQQSDVGFATFSLTVQ